MQSIGHAMLAKAARARAERPCLKQPVLNLAVKNRYRELKQFKLEVNNIFLTKNYHISDAERILPIRLQHTQGVMHVQQESGKTVTGLWTILDDKLQS